MKNKKTDTDAWCIRYSGVYVRLYKKLITWVKAVVVAVVASSRARVELLALSLAIET